jgi:uncharacterized membrane protein affecting hemolysin expression
MMMNDKKIKWLSISVMVLIIINLALIVLIVLPKRSFASREGHQQNRERRGMGFLLKELDLNKSQSIKFRKSGQSHRLEKERLEKELINQKASLVAAIMDTNEPMKESLLVIIGELNQENQQLMIDHFTALRAICTDEQATRLADILSKNQPRGRGRP